MIVSFLFVLDKLKTLERMIMGLIHQPQAGENPCCGVGGGGGGHYGSMLCRVSVCGAWFVDVLA